MKPMRRQNSCEDVSSQYSSTSSCSDSVSSCSPPEEAIHYLADFLDTKLEASVEDDSLVSRLLLPSVLDPLQELNAKDVLEQELKMKQEQVAKMKSTAEKLPKVASVLKAGKSSKSSKRAASPDSDDLESKSASRRYRTHFTPTQLDLLETTFRAQSYPSSSLRQQVHEMTGIPRDNIKVWFQNRRAREKRRGLKNQRLTVSNASSGVTTATSSSSAPRPVPMTTMKMHWPEDSPATTVSSAAPPPPRHHPYQHQLTSAPGMQNRCNWYWANAYEPYSSPSSTTSSSNLPSKDSFKPFLDTYPMPQLPGYGFVKPEPSAVPSCRMPSPPGYTFMSSEPNTLQPPCRRPSPPVGDNFITVPSESHPWSDSVLASL